MAILIKRPGPLTTVQDTGRPGYQSIGVSTGGAMDSLALRYGNLLVGNPEDEAGLEVTLNGTVLQFTENTLISITGGHFQPTIQGISVNMWRPLLIHKGAELRFDVKEGGARAYLCVAGGIAVPHVMGSKSTFLKAQLGGWNGRALKKEDYIPIGKPGPASQLLFEKMVNKRGAFFTKGNWGIAPSVRPDYTSHPTIRVIPSAEFQLFDSSSQEHFFSHSFQVTPQSDRMGYRLSSAIALGLEKPLKRISEPVQTGTIQVPANGHPIVLLADRQTVGGYPCIGHVATVDLPLLGQTKPGDRLQFIPISLEKAQEALIEQEEEVILVKKMIDRLILNN